MKTYLERKIKKVCALSLILVISLASFATGATIVGRGDDISTSIETSRTTSGKSIQYSLSEKQIDTVHLLQHAIKVNRNINNLQSRILEDAADEEEGAEEQEQEDNGDNEDNEDGHENEDENGEGENQDEEDEEEVEEQQDGEEENNAEEEDDEANNDDIQEDDGQGDDEEDDGQGDDEEGDGQEEDAEDDGQQADDDQEGDANQDDDQEEAEDDEVDKEEDEEEVDEEDEDQEPQINFLKCAAFTVEPNIVDTYQMVQNGEIDEDEAAKIENASITEMTSKLNTQESVVFFTYGNGPNDEDQGVYMININDWITASYGYDQICHAIDQDDVDYVFSKIPSFSSAKKYFEHAWYAGFNCNADGTGFKTQLFLDNTCNTFSPALNEYYPFKSANNENRAAQDYSTQVASDLTKYMVQNVNNVIGNSQYCEDSEFCDNVFEKSAEVATCADADDQHRELASYQIESDVASSIQDACPSIQTALSIDDQYEYSSNELKEMVFLWSNTEDGGQEADRKSSIGGSNPLWLYLAGLLAVGTIIAYCIFPTKKKRTREKKKSSIDSDDSFESKKVPLVDRFTRQQHRLRHSESDIVEDLSAIECTVAEIKKSRRKSRSLSRDSRSRSRSRRTLGFKKKMGLTNKSSSSSDSNSNSNSKSKGTQQRADIEV